MNAIIPQNCAPLADIFDHVVGGGFVVDCGGDVYNAPPDFGPPVTQFAKANGWGWYDPPGDVNEVFGLSYSNDSLLAMIRQNTAYKIYRIAKTDGSYTDMGFGLQWSDLASRSDGDAQIGAALPEEAFTSAQLSETASQVLSLTETLGVSSATLVNGAVTVISRAPSASPTWPWWKWEADCLRARASPGDSGRPRWRGWPIRETGRGCFFAGIRKAGFTSRA